MIATVHADTMNLDTVKQELVRYHNTGEYMHQVAVVDDLAKEYLTQRINQNKNSSQPKKLAIILDIDETSLSNYPDMLHMSFGGSKKDILDAIAKAQDPTIQPTLKLFQFAAKNHVSVFFVTGRPESLRSQTVKNLETGGYYEYSGLFMCPDSYKNTSIIPFKSDTRKAIEAKGYDIVLNVGDQESDFAGGYEDKKFKIPNPYYYLA